ncbi:MAG: 23S rRNA methyltransferase [Chromatiales bacterium]|nr:23S rRNA methyltransferase [Chromatiales bacterium]
MASLSSSRWKQRQARDPWVQRARAGGWRSRAIFKLEEIQRRDRLMAPGQLVIDLGAAPGAWSQYAAGVVGAAGHVIAVDLLPMEPLDGVTVIQGDFTDAATLERIRAALDGLRAGLILSDMAPNMSGTRAVDQPRSMYLAELTLELASEALAPRGSMVIKLFQGEGFQEFVAVCRGKFAEVRLRKPEASRQGNRETYLVARNFRL